jgi:hypothetical protein
MPHPTAILQSLQKPCDEALTSSQKSIFSNKFNVFVSKVEEHKRRDKEKEQKAKTYQQKNVISEAINQQNQE